MWSFNREQETNLNRITSAPSTLAFKVFGLELATITVNRTVLTINRAQILHAIEEAIFAKATSDKP